MKLLTKFILIGALVLVGPLYLLVSPILTKAPKEVQSVQKSIQKQVPQAFKDLQTVPKVMSAPVPATSTFFDNLIKNIKEIVTILSSSVGLLLGARELKKEKVKRRANPAPKEPAKKPARVAKKKPTRG